MCVSLRNSESEKCLLIRRDSSNRLLLKPLVKECSVQRIRALDGDGAWLDGGDREVLSKLATARERRRRWIFRARHDFLSFKGKA